MNAQRLFFLIALLVLVLMPAPSALRTRAADATPTSAPAAAQTDIRHSEYHVSKAEGEMLNANGNLGSGTADLAERLTVRGNALILGEGDPIAKGYTSTNLAGHARSM